MICAQTNWRIAVEPFTRLSPPRKRGPITTGLWNMGPHRMSTIVGHAHLKCRSRVNPRSDAGTTNQKCPSITSPRKTEHCMRTGYQLSLLAAASAVVCLGAPALAQDTLKIGELNSYKSQPAFLDPYKKGWELAVEEINAKGGVLGKKLEVVSRDDGASPGDAVRVANELVTREGANIIAGTFLSHIGLAVTEFAGKEKVFFLAAEPLTDKITWQNGNKYT